jgi:hypothetical protein
MHDARIRLERARGWVRDIELLLAKAQREEQTAMAIILDCEERMKELAA